MNGREIHLKVTIMAILALALTGFGAAAQSPERATAEKATAPSPPSRVTIVENPAESMTLMAKLLDQDPTHVAMRVDSEIITQADVADYIRAMPPRLASFGYEGVFSMAVEALSRQKIMLLQARAEGLDKDPRVIRQTAVMAEKILVDAWLDRKVDAAVTEQTLRTWYDRDIVGKPGQEEVRARVIVVANEADARTLIANLKNGADFAEMARAQSTRCDRRSGRRSRITWYGTPSRHRSLT